MPDPTPRPRLPALPAFLGTLLVGLLMVAAPLRAQTLATLTILDGPASLLRGAARLQVAEGLRLQSQDILETPADARLARLEFADGLALSLGPSSRLLVDPRFSGERGRAARVYLLRGWAKLNPAPAGGGKPGAGAPPLASPGVDVLSASGALVLALQDGQVQVFAEGGEAALQERDVGSAVGSAQKLRGGEFFGRAGSAKSAVAPRPPPGFLPQVPRSFQDTLPSRAALFKDREVAPKPVGEIAYAEVRDWLAAEPSLRRGSMNRWKPLTRNPAFRNALVAGMPAHPEWDRVLFPEKYLPKPAGHAPAGSTLR
jgi:hypothetical protein